MSHRVMPWLMALTLLLACWLVLGLGVARAQASANPGFPIAEALDLARSLAQAPAGSRIEVLPGQLDARLRLAPCERVQAYLPTGSRPWGQTRVGLRCTAGAVAWNVFLPVTVKVWGPAVVAARAIGADTPLTAADLQVAEVDLAEQTSPAMTQPTELIGRRLVRPLAPGATLRADAMRLRQWFAPGDLVNVTTRGDGFAVSGEAQALAPGLEGQSVRLRTDSGRILNAWPTGERQAEVRL